MISQRNPFAFAWKNMFVLAMVFAFRSVSLLAQEVADEVIRINDIAFKARVDGTYQCYVILLPKNFDSSLSVDLLIALHGHGSDRWQFVRDNRAECKGARDVAAERGMVFVSPDYRAKTSWMGPSAEADMLQILEALRNRFRVRNVVLSGGSMGATSALLFAAMHPELVDGVVALNGTANILEYEGFSDAIAASYGGSRTDKPNVYRQRSAEFFPERLTMPVASTTGSKDSIVPPDSTLRLLAKLKQQGTPTLSLHRPEGGHETNYDDTVAAFRFVCDQLEQRRKPPKDQAVVPSKP